MGLGPFLKQTNLETKKLINVLIQRKNQDCRKITRKEE